MFVDSTGKNYEKCAVNRGIELTLNRTTLSSSIPSVDLLIRLTGSYSQNGLFFTDDPGMMGSPQLGINDVRYTLAGYFGRALSAYIYIYFNS